jgi:hypothetical protein
MSEHRALQKNHELDSRGNVRSLLAFKNPVPSNLTGRRCRLRLEGFHATINGKSCVLFLFLMRGFNTRHTTERGLDDMPMVNSPEKRKLICAAKSCILIVISTGSRRPGKNTESSCVRNVIHRYHSHPDWIWAVERRIASEYLDGSASLTVEMGRITPGRPPSARCGDRFC